MTKIFNTSADCKYNQHYMVNIEEHLKEIKIMIDSGDYFTINRARQYGKTTIIKALGRYLEQEYTVLSLDYQKLSHNDFLSEALFVAAIANEILRRPALKDKMSESILKRLEILADKENKNTTLGILFECFSRWCEESKKSNYSYY